MTSSPTLRTFFCPSPTTPSWFFPSPTHPSPLFFLPFRRLPKMARTLSDAFRSAVVASENLVKRVHDVRLMRLSIFLDLLLIDISSDAFQQPIRSLHFPKIFPKTFRRCSPPIRSQEICDVICDVISENLVKRVPQYYWRILKGSQRTRRTPRGPKDAHEGPRGQIKARVWNSEEVRYSESESKSECYCAYHQKLVIWHRKSQQSIYE